MHRPSIALGSQALDYSIKNAEAQLVAAQEALLNRTVTMMDGKAGHIMKALQVGAGNSGCGRRLAYLLAGPCTGACHAGAPAHLRSATLLRV
jgi:hypothetical protein